MATGVQNAATLLSRIGLSVRAMKVCINLECETVGDLSNVFRVKGSAFVMGMRNCGKKTLKELSAVVDASSGELRDAQFTSIDPDEAAQNPRGKSRNSELYEFSAKELLEAIERLQIPYGLPIQFVRLPTRIRNWCNSQEWSTLGQFLQNVGAMCLRDFLKVENIGRKSAAEVLGLFDALRYPQYANLRQFLPLAPNSTSVSLTESLNDLVSSLDARDLRMLEMRLMDEDSLEAVGSQFRCTRELVRQVEHRFLRDITRILDWFSDERVELWKVWETTANLAAPLSEKGVMVATELISAAVSTVFKGTPEGKLLQEHWRVTFRNWGRELVASKNLLSEGLDLADFAARRGEIDLACRFQAWLEKYFGDGLSVIDKRATRAPQELTPDQRTLLYEGESHELRWRALYERLKQYCVENGDANVSSGWKADRQLAVWVSSQRERRKKGTMTDEEFALLDELGFSWKSRDVGTWEDRLAEVVAFKASHGHCDIPTVYPDNPKLGRFVNSMRTQRNRGTLSAERVARLDAVGFAWASGRKVGVKLGEQIVNQSWKVRFDELLAYKQSHGDCDVPAKWKQNERLANWVSMQRHRKKRDALPQECVELLESIGFKWRDDHERKSWHVRYSELLRFKEVHGHCDVPSRNPRNPSLGAWVASQRMNRKCGKLSPNQEAMLNEAGFNWQIGTAQKSWDSRYLELLRFRAEHGHCDVPVRNPENAALGTWVAAQRVNRKRGRLSAQQEDLLTKAGFVWQAGSPKKTWHARYAELLEYRAMHGHCDIPTQYLENSALGFWVANQRTNKRLGKLTVDQIRLLDDVGFSWRCRNA